MESGMELKYEEGNLVEDAHQFDVVGHGCNCFCTFGSGVAKAIKNKFPQAYQEDLKTRKGNKDKLGSFTQFYYSDLNLTILNLYTQFAYGRDKVHVDYDALRECMRKVKENFSGKRIAFPKIGAGLAGGDWSIISSIIEEELSNEDVTIITLKEEK